MAYPRTLSDLVNEVLAYGFDGNIYRPRVQSWINEALHRVARKVRLAGHETSFAVNTINGTASYALPTDFVRLLTLRNTTDHQDLDWVSIDELDNSRAAVAKPTQFALYGNSLQVYPTPNGVYALSMRYLADTINLVADADVPAMPDDWVDVLVSYALSRAYRSEDDAQQSAFYWNEFVRDFRDLRADLQQPRDGVARVPSMWAGPRSVGFVRPG